MKQIIGSILIFGFAAALGAMIWFLSPVLTGDAEPWDSKSSYYVWALIAAGFFPACLSSRRSWLAGVGAWLGQLIAFAFRVVHPAKPVAGVDLWPVGLIILCLYSLLSVAGAVLGAGVHLCLRRLFRPWNTHLTR